MAKRKHLESVAPFKEATPTEAIELAKTWSNGVLACRGGLRGHCWEAYNAVHNKKFHYWHVTERCSSCSTLKNIEMDDGGTVYGRWYNYPPGYLSKIGRIQGEAKDALRIVSIQRLHETSELTGRDLREDIPHSQGMRIAVGMV